MRACARAQLHICAALEDIRRLLRQDITPLVVGGRCDRNVRFAVRAS